MQKELWQAAVTLRGSIEPSDYKRYSGCYWSPALSGYCHRYWTQSLFESYLVQAWVADFYDGGIASVTQSQNFPVRCLRVLDNDKPRTPHPVERRG